MRLEKFTHTKLCPVTANSCTDLMEYLVQVSNDNPDEVIYVCEDDYLRLSCNDSYEIDI